MAETFPSALTGFFRSWRGVPLLERMRLMRRMATHLGAPKSALGGEAMANCLYCTRTASCQDAQEAGHPEKAAKFCPNAASFRAAAKKTP